MQVARRVSEEKRSNFEIRSGARKRLTILE